MTESDARRSILAEHGVPSSVSGRGADASSSSLRTSASLPAGEAMERGGVAGDGGSSRSDGVRGPQAPGLSLASMDAATGIRWALATFGLDVVEWLALLHVLTYDVGTGALPPGTGFLEYYFLFVTASMATQFLGILLVRWGWYRTGGVAQIASSLPHVLKGEGIIGVVGGVKAYRYPDLR